MADSRESENQHPPRSRLICVPARDQADHLVGLMLGAALLQKGVSVEAFTVAPTHDLVQTVATDRAEISLISALPPFALVQARSLCRRVRRRFPQMKVVLGLRGATGEVQSLQQRAALDCFDSIVTGIQSTEPQLAPMIAELEPRIRA